MALVDLERDEREHAMRSIGAIPLALQDARELALGGDPLDHRRAVGGSDASK
ncbi:MAG: hypothetical protein HOP15_02440 [Planctomycetes bacterium]|nr:hypothetical protein [Planctomycetota bacterium]